MLDDLGLAAEVQGRREGREGLDSLLHFRDDGLEQAGDLRAGLDLGRSRFRSSVRWTTSASNSMIRALVGS